jgi:SAM-dependent methyltransferase
VSEWEDGSPERKFDPARADRLDAPERETYLPDAPLVALLGLAGEETVIDYGAGTGRLAIAARAALGAGGRVIAVDESEEMVARLRERIAVAEAHVEVVGIASNRVPEPDGTADRVLAVNLLHEVHGERALEEMRRLLHPDGLLLVADWERGRELERPLGPPDEILYSEDEAVAELDRAGFEVERHPGQRWHFVLAGRPRV